MPDTPKKRVSPMAVAVEATALNEYYRNRCLLLADENERLRQANEAQAAELAVLKPADKKPDETKDTTNGD